MDKRAFTLVSCLILLTFLVLEVPEVDAQLSKDAQWAKFGYNNRNSGQSPYKGAQENDLQWARSLGVGGIHSSPAISENGMIYIGGWPRPSNFGHKLSLMSNLG